jgi:hypothetical protein
MFALESSFKLAHVRVLAHDAPVVRSTHGRFTMNNEDDGHGQIGNDKSGVDENARAAMAKKGSPFLNTTQAAHHLGLSPRTLEKMRWEKSGPQYRKHGRHVRYHIDDLIAWSKSRSPQ